MANSNQMYEVLDGGVMSEHKSKTIWKILIWIIIVTISPIIAGFYGYYHNQISFALSPELYFDFLFKKFSWEAEFGTTPTDYPLYAGLIGVMTTWWVGLIAGVVLASIGARNNSVKKMLINTIVAILIMIAVSFTFSMLGLVFGKYILSDGDNYTAASTMHNASYLGGLVGLVAAGIYSWRKRTIANA